MCWSATADLAAGVGIAAVGVACVARVRRSRDLPLAALPLVLGAHQIVESAVWDSGGGTGAATVAWAVIALPLLAVWVPAGAMCAAPPHARRRLTVPLAIGLATAAALADPSSRGEVLAALFLIAYAGLAIPVLAIGLGIALLPAEVALLLFSALILILVNAAVLRMLAAQQR